MKKTTHSLASQPVLFAKYNYMIKAREMRKAMHVAGMGEEE
jgi:hypothetical protein